MFNMPISKVERFYDRVSQVLFCIFETVKMCVAVVYRPPNAMVSSFTDVLQFLVNNTEAVNDDSYQFCD